MRSALGLFSGGLDSWLSALLIKQQGFKVYLLHFSSSYFGYSGNDLLVLGQMVKEHGMELITYIPEQDYLDTVFMNPKYGYGSSKNACIDCHGYMLKIAKQKMLELNAAFVFSGEVVGQRPMSQNKNGLDAVEKESGLDGFLIRPLSARLLPVSRPECEGIVKRDLLLDISGRGRKEQVKLAKELSLEKFPQPSGGCKFTDPNFKKRLSKMLEVNGRVSWDDLKLLKSCRTFYIGNGICFFMTRTENELQGLSAFFDKGIVVEAHGNVPGATGLAIKYGPDGCEISKVFSQDVLSILGRILARYTKIYQQGGSSVDIVFFRSGEVLLKNSYKPFTESEIEKYRL